MRRGLANSWRPFDSLAESYDRWYETPLGSFFDGLERQAVFDLLGAGYGEPGEGTGPDQSHRYGR